jgi:hypothetical protein
MRWGRAALAVTGLFAFSAGLGGNSRGARADDPYFLAAGGGVFDFNRPSYVGQARLELRFADRFLLFKPMLGVLVTTDRAVYGYGGVRIDLYIDNRWVVTPNAALGGYYRGDGIDLGSTLEFKTGAELDYRFDDHSRLGIAIDHISNAGITKQNPGSNTLLLYYSYPFGPMKH